MKIPGKILIAKTPISDWIPENIDGCPFYERYENFVNVFARYVKSIDFEKCFAEPIFNDERKEIEWYIYPLRDGVHVDIEAERQRLRSLLKESKKKIPETSRNACNYIDVIIKSLESGYSEKVIFGSDGALVFGVWGLLPTGVKDISEVIVGDVEDNRIYTIRYEIEGEGKLSFKEIKRRHGHVLTGLKDVPELYPSDGYRVQGWRPDSPFNTTIDRNLTFTAVFVKDITDGNNDGGREEVDGGDEDRGVIDEPNELLSYDVKFTTDGYGSLEGNTEYKKNENEFIDESEIPVPKANDNYRFVKWDKNPKNHQVTEDIEFRALFERVPDELGSKSRWSWWGCLNWLLALLLLLLLGFLLWFLFGHHDFSLCGCDCEPVIVNICEDSDPIPSVCDALVVAGNNNREARLFDMGKQSGTFTFEYATGGGIADRIVIYDGKDKRAEKIFDYYGVTGDCPLNGSHESATLRFNNRYIYVEIIPDPDPGTCWQIRVNCPN